MPRRALTILLLSVACLSSCRTLGYYGQAVAGQWEILRKSRPIQPMIEDPATEPRLRRQLAAVQRIRRYAGERLDLPGSRSYGTYADLGRDYVVTVVYAAPELSLEPKSWWYPTLGRLEYRGYFSAAAARQLGARLEQQGYDVAVDGVDAYSSLGWFHDPVLNGFVYQSDIYLAELIFHELTHHKLFRPGDTTFNESLAIVYAEEGVRRWLRDQGRHDDLRRYRELLARRDRFYDHIDATRRRLEGIYASDMALAEKRRAKAAALRALQEEFRGLRQRWGGRGLESWLRRDINNAHLVSVLTYQEGGRTLRRLLAACGGDLRCFLDQARHVDLGTGPLRPPPQS